MAKELGLHSEPLGRVRALQSAKGRREQRRFAFEGPTLLEEARISGVPIDEVFCTAPAYEATPALRDLDANAVPTFIVSDRAMANISDLTTPSGIVAVATIRLQPLGEAIAGERVVLVLADVNDPANAGTLMRSADAFGCRPVVFGRLGIDPYHPKAVRASMGAIFRLGVALADPEELAQAAEGLHVVGLTSHGAPLAEHAWEAQSAVIVGNERHGLGRWEECCERLLAIPMSGHAESVSAAVAGSIALYEATARRK